MTLMQLTTGPPLLFALGLRILLNTLVLESDSPPSTSDFLLTGLFQGVLLHHTLTQLPQFVIPVGFGIGAWVLLDFLRAFDTTKCACTLLGAALGVLFTDVLDKFFQDEVPPTSRDRDRDRERPAYEPTRRLRLVSFGRGQDRDRDRHRERHTHADERERERERERRSRRREVRALTPTLTYASTAPSISLDSVPSSIDPEGKLSPQEREIAVLRARASLADLERRRCKEERKWALSQGNTARADLLAFHVTRWAGLMESYHRSADQKVVEAARAAGAAASATGTPSRRRSHSKLRQSSSASGAAQGSVPPSQPLVSVTVGTSQRRRKISGGSSGLRPAIRMPGRDLPMPRS